MGGKALKGLISEDKVVRVDEATLLHTKDKTESLMAQFFVHQDLKMAMPKYVGSKETFGDLDLLVGVDLSKMNTYKEDLKKFLQKELNVVEFNVNSNIMSFGYPLDTEPKSYFQVDLIFTTPENFEPNYHYLCYNDLSNFMGRLARNIGLKYGMNGLFIEVSEENGRYNKDIYLTKNINKILEILDLDKEKFHEGFKSFEEIFEYLSTSKYFSPLIFDLDNRNHDARQRDKKREGYMKLLDFCVDYEDKTMKTYFSQDSLSDFIATHSLDEYTALKIMNLNTYMNNFNLITTLEDYMKTNHNIHFDNEPNIRTFIVEILEKSHSENNKENIALFLKEKFNIVDDNLVDTIEEFNKIKKLKEFVYDVITYSGDENPKRIQDKIYSGMFELYHNNKELILVQPPKNIVREHYLMVFGKYDEYQELLKEIDTNKYIQTYFNGNIVADIYGVSGKDLGVIMKKLSSPENKEIIKDCILSTRGMNLSERQVHDYMRGVINTLVNKENDSPIKEREI